MILIIDLFGDDDPVCLTTWDPPDIDDDITICTIPTAELLAFQTHLFPTILLLILSLNMSFGLILITKLRRMISMTTPRSGEAGRNDKLTSLIYKITALTISGCITTVIGQIGWWFTSKVFCLFLDHFINSLIIGMLMKHNDGLYRYCAPCTRCICVCFKFNPQMDGKERTQKTEETKTRTGPSNETETTSTKLTACNPFSTVRPPHLVIDMQTNDTMRYPQSGDMHMSTLRSDDGNAGDMQITLHQLTNRSELLSPTAVSQRINMPDAEDIQDNGFISSFGSSSRSLHNDFQTDESGDNICEISKNFDFGVYLEYWRRGRKNYVNPKYENLKEESTKNQYSKIREETYIELAKQCEQYLNRGYKAKDIGIGNKICKIAPGSPITIEHLIVLKMYSDFDEMQREFKRHCRRLRNGESMKSVRERNREIAHWSRLLRESVMFWGKTMTKKDQFYCGVSARLVLRSLNQRFECPLSTTKDFDVAQRFTDGLSGVVLRMKRANQHTRYFDMVPFSSFSEAERVFFGSTIRITGILVYNNDVGKWESLKPKYFVAALTIFEQIYNGHFVDGKAEARALLQRLLHLAKVDADSRSFVIFLALKN